MRSLLRNAAIAAAHVAAAVCAWSAIGLIVVSGECVKFIDRNAGPQ